MYSRIAETAERYRANLNPDFKRILNNEKAWKKWEQTRTKLRCHGWTHHNKVKSVKDCDRHLKRDLEAGWLMPFLLKTDDLLWGRWSYWTALQRVPAEAMVYLESEAMRSLLTGEKARKAKDITQFTNLVLPRCGIPQLEFRESKLAEKVILNCLDVVDHGDVWDRVSAVELFLDWFLWAVGHPGCDYPSKLSLESSMLLYQIFDVGMLSLYPHDYMGSIMTDSMSKTSQSKTGFFPTPNCLAGFMTRVANVSDGRDARLQAVLEPSIGTGVLGLHTSNHTLSLVGVDINLTALKGALFQYYVYAPWYAIPIWWLDGDLIWGNSLDNEPGDSLCRKRFNFKSLVSVRSKGGEFERRKHS